MLTSNDIIYSGAANYLNPVIMGFEEVIQLKTYPVKNIRNIAIAGHTGKGKTALSEAMLYVAGVTDRLGKVIDGNTIMDYDAEEKKRQCSISSAMASLEWRDTKINILDAPG